MFIHLPLGLKRAVAMAIPRVIKTPNTLNLGSFHSFSFPEILHRLHATHLKSIFLKMNISDFKSVYINRSKSYESRCIESWIIANLSDLSESSTVCVLWFIMVFLSLDWGSKNRWKRSKSTIPLSFFKIKASGPIDQRIKDSWLEIYCGVISLFGIFETTYSHTAL